MAPKKKLTKKEKQRLESEKAEASRAEQEKERQRHLEEEREAKRLERLDAERRQKQEVEENKIRRVQLKESCDYFNNLLNDVNIINAKIRKRREWTIYMRCNGLPNTYDPGDIRKYIHMWLLDNKRSNETERNWLLSTNETSILTQDHRVVNMTRSHLKQQQHNLGDLFAKRTNEVLGILKEIDEAIFDTNHLSKAVRADLNNLKYIFRTTLSEYIDEFSYKILSNIDRDMDLEGLSLARHQYESDVFKTQLWTLREAPMPPLNPKEQEKANRSHTEIDFPLIGSEITLPPSVKMMNTAVRVLWLNYDHFSDYSPSYIIPNNSSRDQNEFDDISKAARKEWRKRKELLQNILLENESPKTNGKEPKEVMGVVDVDKLYENYENEQAELAMKLRGPHALGLKEFDINMRKHRIVAGIYYVEHLEQPQQDTQLQAKKFLRTLSYPNHLRRIGFHQTYKPPPPVLPGVRRLPEEIEAEMREVEANLDRLGSVNIKLPEDVIWFEPPVVCRWESVEESNISEHSEPESDAEESKTCVKDMREERVVIEDFNLLNVPAGLDLFTMFKDFVVPRMPDGYIVKMGDIELKSRKSSNDTQQLQIIEPCSNPRIKDSMIPTNSPRPLFPSVEINQELQIVDKSTTTPDDDKSDDSDGDRVYMFSKLLSDLDEISDLQIPYPDALLDDITENFEEEEEQEEEIETEQDYMGISFMRANDFSWSLGRKEEEEVQDTTQQSEDYGSDSELGDDDNESANTTKNDETAGQIGKWSSRDVHDVKFNEEKLSIQFKFGRMGAFGLAINWYNNLPFQGWELKPDNKDSDFVIFNLSGAVISIEVSVISEGFILNSYQGGMSSIVQDIIGITMNFDKLKDTLFRAAINLFPEDDAFCYTEGTCEKNAMLEFHAYTCMAALALTHNFAWSRWNMLSGRRSCVVLMREVIENRKLPPYSTLLLTPQKATLVDCTDVSPSFSPKPIEGMNFYADLHHLAQDQSTPASLEKHSTMDTLLRQNIITLLKATRPLSFC